MLPSNLNLKIGPTKGYNNKILMRSVGIKTGPNIEINKEAGDAKHENLRVGVWNFLQWRLALEDTALSLFYAVSKSWVSIINSSGTLLKN